MRELKRSIAKANMREAGFTKLCKKYRWTNTEKSQSPFSRFWKKWIHPRGQEAQALRSARRNRTKTSRKKVMT